MYKKKTHSYLSIFPRYVRLLYKESNQQCYKVSFFINNTYKWFRLIPSLWSWNVTVQEPPVHWSTTFSVRYIMPSSIPFFLYYSWNLKLSLTIFQTLFTDVRRKFWWNNFGVSLLYLTVPKVFTQIVIWSPDTRSVTNTNNYNVIHT